MFENMFKKVLLLVMCFSLVLGNCFVLYAGGGGGGVGSGADTVSSGDPDSLGFGGTPEGQQAAADVSAAEAAASEKGFFGHLADALSSLLGLVVDTGLSVATNGGSTAVNAALAANGKPSIGAQVANAISNAVTGEDSTYGKAMDAIADATLGAMTDNAASAASDATSSLGNDGNGNKG